MDVNEFAQKLIDAEIEAWYEGKYEKFRELEHPDVIYHQDTDLLGIEAHKEYLLGARQAFSEPNQNWKFLVGNEGIIVLSVDGDTTMFMPPQGTGAPEQKGVNINALMVFRLESEKVVEVWEKHTMTFLDG